MALISEPQEQRGCDDDLERVPDRLAEDGPPRCREVADEQVAGDNPRPEARPADHERSDADPDWWPQRGHGAM